MKVWPAGAGVNVGVAGCGGVMESTMATWRRWLVRLAFSCVVLAFVFGWQGWRLAREQAPPWKVYGSYALAVVFASAGLAGMRERHRS